MPLGNELIPSIGQAASAPLAASALPALPAPVIIIGGGIIAAVKILDIIVNGEDSSA